MRIRELDGLRGIAVLAVVAFHYLAWLPQTGSNLGWLGVDLFFILSGFLITSILVDLRGQDHYFTVFYSRRAFRIFPPYFLAIALYLVISFATGMRGTLGLWMQYVFYYTSLFVGQPPELHAIPPVLPAFVAAGLSVMWSLSVEEIYYTVWAPMVRYTTQRSFTAILGAMILAAPLLRWWLHTPDYPESYTFYCRMDGLAYGSAIALLVRNQRMHPERWAAWNRLFPRLAGIVIAITAAFWIVTKGDKGLTIVSTVGIVLADISFAAFTYLLIHNSGSERLWVRIFRARWLRSLGKVSYSLYLFHYPMRIAAADFVEKLHLSRRVSLLASVSLGVTLSLIVAYGLWYGVESHILRWKDRIVPSSAHAKA